MGTDLRQTKMLIDEVESGSRVEVLIAQGLPNDLTNEIIDKVHNLTGEYLMSRPSSYIVDDQEVSRLCNYVDWPTPDPVPEEDVPF